MHILNKGECFASRDLSHVITARTLHSISKSGKASFILSKDGKVLTIFWDGSEPGDLYFRADYITLKPI